MIVTNNNRHIQKPLECRKTIFEKDWQQQFPNICFKMMPNCIKQVTQ